MKVRRIVVGPLLTNCYIVWEEGEAVVVDPGDEESNIRSVLEKEGLAVRRIVVTHGHFDHVYAADPLSKAVGAQASCHRLEAEGSKPLWYLQNYYYDENRPFPRLNADLDEGAHIEFGGTSLRVLHTPGHTGGSICLVSGEFILTGDTLFRGSVGRTDFGGNWEALQSTLKRLSSLDGDLVVLPGHGEESTMEHEVRTNRFLLDLH